ncbi:MAG: L-serine ammonia-lyase, iron-sulfur-dependent subunit beta [Oscillospiraceae bacterium]
MNLSIFDVIGPVMIGPSSSHTAGAARFARAAAMLCASKFDEVRFSLHGSFALTGEGHGTHEALLGGALGLEADDERIKGAFALAEKQGVKAVFDNVEMPDAHANSARIAFYCETDKKCEVEGSSIGGGRILITGINGCKVQLSCERPTLIITQRDEPGVVSEITGHLAHGGINIALMQVTRKEKGKTACTVIETDSDIPISVKQELEKADNIISVQILDMK